MEAKFARQELPVHTIAKIYWLAGHARVYVSFDLLFRYLKHKGYKVSKLAAHLTLADSINGSRGGPDQCCCMSLSWVS